MTRGGVDPDWPATGRALCSASSELVRTGQYDQAAEILREAQKASARSGDPFLARVLRVACRLCLACGRCQALAETHRHAEDEARQIQQELQKQLDGILDLVGKEVSPDTPPRQMGPQAARIAEVSPTGSGPSQPAKRSSLWQRILALLRHGPDPRMVQHKDASAPAIARSRRGTKAPPTLTVYCLGPFQVYQDDQPIENWPSNKGKSIFKYLVTHREHPVAKEMLMELFWPGAHPDAARNNLNVAIYGLRQALREARPNFSHVLFQDDCYLLNPDLRVWVDSDAFAEHLKTAQKLERCGDLNSAIREYRAADALYQGQFLEEDRYEDWLIPQRQQLQDDYLRMLDRVSRYCLDRADYSASVAACTKMLAVDRCCEEAHRRLMRCYSRQGQPNLALRQYHLCVEALKEELDVLPTPTTREIYERIRCREEI